MRDPLPPDLDRLGDQLEAATRRARARRRRRRARLAGLGITGAAAAIALGVFAPGVLRPADPVRTIAVAAASYQPTACDQPRGATFAAARPCAAPGTTDVAPDQLARRLAVR